MFDPSPTPRRSRPPRAGAGLAAALALLLLAWLLGRAGGATVPAFFGGQDENRYPGDAGMQTPPPGAGAESGAGAGGPPRGGPTAMPSRSSPPSPPRSDRDPEARYTLVEDRRLAGYRVQRWQREDEGMHFDDVLRFFADSEPSFTEAGSASVGEEAEPTKVVGGRAIELRGAVELHPLSGEDLDGDGLPELVIQRYSGGAHCCFSTHVYTLAPAPEPARLLMRTPDSNCPGDFEDLDGDGLPEFVTCDDLMAYARCPYAISPMPRVYLRAEPGLGYLPASARFAERYAAGIEAKKRALQASAAGRSGSEGESAPLDGGAEACEVLDVTLDLLYAGRAAEGWRFLDEHYRGADAEGLRAEVEAALAASPYYLREGEAPRPVKAPEEGG